MLLSHLPLKGNFFRFPLILNVDFFPSSLCFNLKKIDTSAEPIVLVTWLSQLNLPNQALISISRQKNINFFIIITRRDSRGNLIKQLYYRLRNPSRHIHIKIRSIEKELFIRAIYFPISLFLHLKEMFTPTYGAPVRVKLNR